MRFASSYAVVVGALMLVVWAFLLLAGQVPDIDTELPALVFHWAAELLTAVGLIASGLALGRGRRWAAWGYPLAMGMLVYSLVNSPGFYAQAQEWGVVALFAVLLLPTVLALALFVRRQMAGR
jgi:hypothetical protein